MNIYTSSRELKGIRDDVKYLSFSMLSEVSAEDIVIATGTFGDEITIKSLLQRGVVPVVILIKDKDQEVNSFVENISLTITRKNLRLDDDFLNECKDIAQNTKSFCEAVDAYDEQKEIDRQKEEEERLLYLYAMSEIINSLYPTYQRNQLRGLNTKEKNINFHYILHQTGGKGRYLFLIKGDRLKVYAIGNAEKSIEDLDGELFLPDDSKYEQIYKGEYNFLEDIQPYKLQDISDKYNKEYMLIYSSEIYDPEQPFNKDSMKLFEATLTEDNEILFAHEDVKQLFLYRLLDFKGSKDSLNQMKSAIEAVKSILSKSSFDKSMYRGLFTFLEFQKNAKKLIGELNSFERSILFGNSAFNGVKNEDDTEKNLFSHITKRYDKVSDVFCYFYAKLVQRYNNKKYKVANIDFAYLLLSSKDINSLSDDELNTIFQDIKSGIDINSKAKDSFNENISAKQYESFVKNVKEAHEKILNSTTEDYIKNKLQDYGNWYSFNLKDEEYINFLISCLDRKEDSKLIKSLKKILQFLGAEDTIPITPEIEDIQSTLDSENDLFEFTKKFLLSLLSYRGDIKINTKNLAKAVGMFLAESTIEDSGDVECFFLFLREYNEFDLIKVFEEFLEESFEEGKRVDLYIKEIFSYECEKSDDQTIIKGLASAKTDSIRKSLQNYKNNQVQKLRLFMQYLLGLDNGYDDISCDNEATIGFLSIFAGHEDKLRGSDKCQELIKAFFSS